MISTLTHGRTHLYNDVFAERVIQGKNPSSSWEANPRPSEY